MDKPQVFGPADVLIPASEDMMVKWSVIACDQHTSEPEYWERVDKYIGSAPSTLRMMLPEYKYYDENLDMLIGQTRTTIDTYLNSGVLKKIEDTYIYVERTLYNGKVRRGLIGQIDLECYEHNEISNALIRSTEGIVKEKMPPRIKLRENASVELSHVLVLVDDPKKTLIEPLAGMTGEMEKIYDFELMENGGHIRGYCVNKEGTDIIQGAIDRLMDAENFNRRYKNENSKPVLLFATGDGNHSLATAKACWKDIKQKLKPEELENHPARFSLVELINIHDAALEFEPINRVVFECDPKHLMESLLAFYEGSLLGLHDGHHISFSYGDEVGIITIKKESSPVAIGALGKFLDHYLKENSGRVDYVHGDDVVVKLSQHPGTIGFVLPAIDKSSFFASIILGGAFPRKTFSMGSARDKRYYLECRKVTK